VLHLELHHDLVIVIAADLDVFHGVTPKKFIFNTPMQ
jgi:hypothetical protein